MPVFWYSIATHQVCSKFLAALGRRAGWYGSQSSRWPISSLAALSDSIEQVEGGFLANDDVVTARIDRIASSDAHLSFAVGASHFQTAHHARAVQIAVLQAILRNLVRLFAIEFVFGEKLSGEVAAGLQARQTTASGTAA